MKNYGCWRGQEVYIRRIKIWTKGFWVNSSFNVDTPHLFLHCWRKIHWQQLRKTVKKEKLNEKTHRKHPIFRISPFRIWNAPSLHYGVHTTIFGAKYVGVGVWKAHNIFQLSWLRYECSNTIILKCMGGIYGSRKWPSSLIWQLCCCDCVEPAASSQTCTGRDLYSSIHRLDTCCET